MGIIGKDGGSGSSSGRNIRGGSGGGDAGTAVAIEVATSTGSNLLSTNTIDSVVGGNGGPGGNGATTNGNGGVGGDADGLFLISASIADASGNSVRTIRGGTGGNGAAAGGGSGNGASGGDRGGVRFSELLLELGHDDARRPGRGRTRPHGRGPGRGRARDHLGIGDEGPLAGGHGFRRDEGRSGRRSADPDFVRGRVLPHRQQDLHDPLHSGQRDLLLDRELRVLCG